VAHRDIKPENIMFMNKHSLRVKIVDFGTAQKVNPTLYMTEPFGSPYYMAPEVIRGCYTSKCDIWSVGVILHIMIIGTPPFMHDDNKKLLLMIKTATQIGFENRLWKTRSIGCIDLVKKLMDCNFT
jgi:calcium-dependent protein kinase